jgi:hypothetical protein
MSDEVPGKSSSNVFSGLSLVVTKQLSILAFSRAKLLPRSVALGESGLQVVLSGRSHLFCARRSPLRNEVVHRDIHRAGTHRMADDIFNTF